MVQIGSDGLRKQTKRKKTTRKPTPQVTPQPYMTPIFVPPQPAQIVRQRIQNQALIQEQLRAYDRQQQALVGANISAFNANNIGRKTALYADPVIAEPIMNITTAEEQEREADPRTTEQLMRPKDEPLNIPEEEEKGAEEQPQPKRLRTGRPKGELKDRRELIQEIKGAGSIPRGTAVDKLKIDKLREMAIDLGIDPMR